MGLDHGWNTSELNRAAGEVFAGLAALAVDSVPTIDLDTATPDETANPDGESLGYTNEGWTAKTTPTLDQIKVDEEAEAVATFISGNEVSLAGAIRQVKNLARLARLTPGAVYTPPSGGVEKLTGGGLTTFEYDTVMLVWKDANDGSVWAFVLYRTINTAGLEFGIGRTKDSAVNVNFIGYTDSTRSAGDRVWALIHYEAAGS